MYILYPKNKKCKMKTIMGWGLFYLPYWLNIKDIKLRNV